LKTIASRRVSGNFSTVVDISDIKSAYKHYNNQAEIKDLLKQ
jgi:hypothetical protein